MIAIIILTVNYILILDLFDNKRNEKLCALCDE